MKIDNNKVIAIQVHVLCYSYPPFFKDFSILTKGNGFELKIMESLLIELSSSISSCVYMCRCSNFQCSFTLFTIVSKNLSNGKLILLNNCIIKKFYICLLDIKAVAL